MRILQLHNRHAGRGGADDVLDLEGSVLSAGGHDVDQWTLPPASSTARLGSAVDAVWNRAAAREVAARVRAFRPDVVHVHTPFPTMSPAVFRAAHRLGCPTVTTCHSYRYSCVQGTLTRDGAVCEDCVGRRLKLPGVVHGCYHDSRAASLSLTVSLVLHRAIGTFRDDVDRFVAITEFGRQLLIRDGMPPEQVVVKPNAVADPGEPIDRPRAAEAGPYIVFAGRLVQEKGVATLLSAAGLIGDLRLVIAGDGPLRDDVVRAASQTANIEYVGWVDEGRLNDLIAGAVLTVTPSEWYEVAPLTLIRSLGAGTPVVCSDLENICASVVASDAGRTFRTGDPRSLAAAVVAAVSDSRWLAGAGRRARELYLRDHTPEATLRSLEAIYADAISDHAAAGHVRTEAAR